MTCRDGVRLLTDYLEGIVPAGTRRSLDAHVAGCPRCQGFVKSYVATPIMLRAATNEAMPNAMRERLKRRLARERS